MCEGGTVGGGMSSENVTFGGMNPMMAFKCFSSNIHDGNSVVLNTE